ncbi:hypothetical protein DMX02_03680 [Pseudomonas jessenii]|nr:hypothetical protein DMX02_03680 [Pseudomonas jessenii]
MSQPTVETGDCSRLQLAHSAQTFEPDTGDAREDRRLREALFDLRDALLSHLQKQTHEANHS